VGLRETVTLGRVQVRHGDIVVADETGILIVPPEHKDAIVGKAAEVRDAEVEEIARLRQGMPLR
jgi:regulator of RNase E activity RraA